MHSPKRFAAWDTLLAGANAPKLQGAPLAGWATNPSCPNPIVEPRMHYLITPTNPLDLVGSR